MGRCSQERADGNHWKKGVQVIMEQNGSDWGWGEECKVAE